MSAIDVDVAAIGGIPDLHCGITSKKKSTSRDDAPAIGRPRHYIHVRGMPTIGVKEHSQGNRSRGRGQVRDRSRRLTGHNRRMVLLRRYQPDKTTTNYR